MKLSKTIFALIAAVLVATSGCGYNAIQSQDEGVQGAWADVVNQYKRRADLIPNLVSTVKGYAEHEQEVLTKVTEARSKATSVSMDASLLQDEAAFKRFQEAQGAVSGALSRLLAVAENYPQLKADANFRDLQAQLEGTENRITVARTRYIDAVRTYNTTVRSFPSNLTAKLFGAKVKPTFTVENEKEIAEAPKVSF
ncbi:MAG: LemA family protein [Pseudomonadota bacterium]|jgi:LemA protein